MPHRLKERQAKIQVKRKQTPWREFVRDVCSRGNMNIGINQGMKTRYPETGREGNFVQTKFYDYDDIFELDYSDTGFFSRFGKLFLKQKKMALPCWYENENSDFVDSAFGAKNGYLCFYVGINAENIFYSAVSWGNITNIFNCFVVNNNSQNIYQSRIVTNSMNIFCSQNIHNSNNIRSSSNLIGCKECIASDNLQNAAYVIFNEQYSKEEYLQKKEEYLKDFHKTPSREITKHDLLQFASENSTGGGFMRVKDSTNCFACSDLIDSNNCIGVTGSPLSTNIYDCFNVGNTAHDFYGVIDAGTHAQHVYCSMGIGSCSFIYYSMYLEACSYCLGCIGLKNKSYCIFNKQYSKEERHDKVDKIFSVMEEEGILGDFFPGTMNPFYFNDTASYLIDDSFTKEEVESLGYLWRDKEVAVDIPEGMEIVKVDELDDFEGRVNNQRKINPDILKKVIQDEEGNVYRVVKMEYDFLIKHGLPLPRKHRLERLKMNFRIN